LFEEAKLELFFGQLFDGGVVGGFEVLASVVVFGDLPGGVEAAEGAGADLDAEFFPGETGGFEGAVLFVDEDELLFLVGC